jgi:putative aldouronate transport system substrate-binding protein
MPTTTAEYEAMLRAFKDNDPNGNGRKDEIPLIGSTDGWCAKPVDWLMNAFVYDDTNLTSGMWVVENGKLSLNYYRPEWREGLRYISKLCKDGLLSPLSLSQTEQQIRTIMAGGDRAVVGTYVAGSQNSTLGGGNPRIFEYEPLAPIAGPKGVRWAARTNSSPSLPFSSAIASTCPYPELAFRLADMLCSEEAYFRGRWGIPGQDFDWAQPGDKSIFPDLYPATIKIKKEIWGMEHNSHWNNSGSSSFAQLAPWIDGTVYDGTPSPSYNVALSVALYQPFQPKEFIFRLIYGDSEMEDVAEILTDLNSYRDEHTALFVTGDWDINNDAVWNTYLSDLKSIGIDRYIDYSQKAYDRMNKGN